jgi:hypothetical protein
MYLNEVGGDSLHGIETCYMLNDMGIESRWSRDLPHQSTPSLEPHTFSYKVGTASLLRG